MRPPSKSFRYIFLFLCVGFFVLEFLLAYVSAACVISSQERIENHDSLAPIHLSLGDLASRILKDAPQVGCLAHECKILVLNFAMPSGISPVYGSLLADELSKQLADLQKDTQLFDRNLLKTYLAIANLPSGAPRNDADAREFAHGLGATAVVTGGVEKTADNSLHLSAQLLATKNDGLSGPKEEVVVPPPPADLPNELQPPSPPVSRAEPGPSAPYDPNSNGFPSGKRKAPVAGIGGVSLPSCFYMPNPPYTKEARDAKFSGSVLVEGIVGLDGKITNLRILKSPGLGLDDQIIRTLKTWRCRPANGPNGKPVPVIVPFQVNFRLY